MTIKKEINKLLIKQIGDHISSKDLRRSFALYEDKGNSFYVYEFEGMLIVYEDPYSHTEYQDSVYIKLRSFKELNSIPTLSKDVSFNLNDCVRLDDDSQKFLKSKIIPLIIDRDFESFEAKTFKKSVQLINSLDNSLDEESPKIKAQDFFEKYLDFSKMHDLKKAIIHNVNNDRRTET